jgi:hypothetical protein
LEYVIDKGKSIAVKINCDMPKGVSIQEGTRRGGGTRGSKRRGRK